MKYVWKSLQSPGTMWDCRSSRLQAIFSSFQFHNDVLQTAFGDGRTYLNAFAYQLDGEYIVESWMALR